MSNWIRVNRHHPCKVCGKPDWCRYLPEPDNGSEVFQCARVESKYHVKSRDGEHVGWIHKFATGAARIDSRPVQSKPKPEPILTQPQIAAMVQYGSDRLDEGRLERFSKEIGLSVTSLKRMYIGWHPKRLAWFFPMVAGPSWNMDCAVGIRTRYASGAKRAVSGSHNGLFVPSGLTGIGPLLIEEGPTSTAALLDMGFDAIGRPFVPGGVELIRQFARNMRNRPIVVVANNDEAKTRPDGSIWYPGQEGGEALAQILANDGHQVKMILPIRCKDSKDWLGRGATHSVVMAVIGVSRNYRKDAA